MAIRSDSLKEKLIEAPIAPAYGSYARQGRGMRAYRSAPPCVTAGQLLRSALLIFAVLVYADATRLRAWLLPPATQSERGGVDATPVAAIRAARTSAEPQIR